MKQETVEVRGYEKLDDVIRKLGKHLITSVHPTLGYDRGAFVDRLSQKITMMITVPFLREGAARHVAGSSSFPSDDRTFTAGGIHVDTSAGWARPVARLLLRHIGQFVALWSAFIVAGAVSAMSARRRSPVVIVFGVAAADLMFQGSDARFIEYCRRGPLKPLRDAKKLFVHTPHKIKATRPDEAAYTRFPLLHVFATQQTGFGNFLFFVAEHMRALFAFTAALMRAPVHSILWRDFAEHAAAAALNRASCIDAVIITNSNWLQQFLWMNALYERRFRCHMALYSLNSHSIVYKGDPVDYPYPGIRQLKVDDVWVWNEPYRARLAADGVSVPSVVVEPILWYLPQRPQRDVNPEGFMLCVFDVQPRTVEASRAQGSLVNYYNTETAIRFIDDIVRARDEVARRTGAAICIVLKHKRPATRQHDPRYFEHVQKLVKTVPGLTVAASDSNVYELIFDSQLVIAPPYSSPVYVAAHVGVPAIFYDASGEVLPTHAPHPLVRFVDGRDSLESAVNELVSSNNTAPTRQQAFK